MLNPESEQTHLEQSILAILRQLPLAVQRQILAALQHLQSRLTASSVAQSPSEPTPIASEVSFDQAMDYVLQKNAELLDRLA